MFAVIYIPEFPFQAIARYAPELRKKPVAVVDGKPPLLKVVSRNAHAKNAGIDTGMTDLQVRELFQAEARQRSAALETSAHAAMIDCACTCSPRVEDTAPDTLVLDIDGMDRLFGSAAKLAGYIARQILTVGLQPKIAVASNPDAAIHAARGFPRLTLIPEGQEQERLGALPLDILGAPESMLQTFTSWGLHHFKDLARLHPRNIAERFGQEGIRYHALASGSYQRPLVPMTSEFKIQESLDLDYRITLLEQLGFILKRLLDSVCARLAARNLATMSLHLECVLEDRAVFTRTLTLPLPMRNARTFHKLLQLDLESHPPGKAITAVRLLADPVDPRVTQHGLFVPLAPEPEKLELTLARIGGLVGQDRVGAVELLDSHRPGAFEMKRFVVPEEPARRANAHRTLTHRCAVPPLPLTRERAFQAGTNPLPPGRERAALKRKVSEASSPLPPRRERGDRAAVGEGAVGEGPQIALRHFRPPFEATLALRWGVPSRMRFLHQSGRIVRASGPWRNVGGWWTDAPWSRDEWDVAVDAGSQTLELYRIYQELTTGQWFVEGIYD